MLMHPPAEPGFRARALAWIVSYSIAGACLYWAFHDLNFRELLHSFTGVNWWWVPAAVVCVVLVYVAAGWQWQVLLRPAARISVRKTTQAVFAGRFANDVLPMHVGYVIRVYLVSRWTQTGAVAVAPSLLVERLFDGFWLALGIGLAALFLPLPPGIGIVAEIWTGIIVFGLLAGAFIVLRKPKPERNPSRGNASPKWFRKIYDAWTRALQQVRAIGRSWLVLAAFAISFLKFAMQCLAFLFLLWAYHFHFPLLTQLTIFLVAYVGLSMPSTPASVGVFQLFCIAGLEMFHVPKSIAAGFSFMAFAVLTIPLSLAGFIAFAQSGLTLHQLWSNANAGKVRALANVEAFDA